MNEPWSREWKIEQLQILYEAWKDCKKCELGKRRRRIVFGEGNPEAEIMLISEAPGEEENKMGRPFIGRAGQLLNSLFRAANIKRDELFITNMVACWPPNNRDPIKAEKEACSERLNRLIYVIDPLLIITAGKVAFESLIKARSRSIEKEHGRLFSSPDPKIRVAGERNGADIPGVLFPKKTGTFKWTLNYDVVPIYHPSYILRTDNYDEKKKTYETGGLAHQTVNDLREAFARVERLKKEHEMTRRLLRRQT